jgi:hypothetical protein
MITNLILPSKHLTMYKSVDIDTEMAGSHHKTLLTTNENLWERAVASVIDDLLQDDYSVNKISFPDLIYLFFIIRTQTLGTKISSSWECQRMIRQGETEGVCGNINEISMDFSSFKITEVPTNFVYPLRDIKVKGEVTKCYCKLLTIEEEFNLIDAFLEKGHSKQDLRGQGMYDYARMRLNQALSFEDVKYSTLTVEEKEEILDANSYLLLTSLLKDLEFLVSIGVDLSPRKFNCTKCKGVAQVAIPFSGGFLLPSKK